MADTPQEAGTLRIALDREYVALAAAVLLAAAIAIVALMAARSEAMQILALVAILVAVRTAAVARMQAFVNVVAAWRTKENRPIAETIGLPEKLVAGTGFEPVTFGL